MGDIRTNPTRFDELRNFVRRFEGRVNHFYCDSRGLVTIGSGILVDSTSGFTPTQLSNEINQLITQYGNIFLRKSTHTTAPVSEVITDWNNVKHAYNASHPAAAFYNSIAQLYITSASINALLTGKLNGFIADYSSRQGRMS